MKTVPRVVALLTLAGAINLAADASAQVQAKKNSGTPDTLPVVVSPSSPFGSQGTAPRFFSTKSVSHSNVISNSSGRVRTFATTATNTPTSPRQAYRFVRVLLSQQTFLVRQSAGIAARLARLEAQEKTLVSLNNPNLGDKIGFLRGQIESLYKIGLADNNTAASFAPSIQRDLSYLNTQVSNIPPTPPTVGSFQAQTAFNNAQIQANAASYRSLSVSF
jgi:hypothetical protein